MSARTETHSVKTVSHLSLSNSRMIFAAADAALLPPGKDNKVKSAGKSHRQAVRVRFPAP